MASDAPKHILFLRPDAIGDNILASSMLQPLRLAYSGTRITAVCLERCADLYARCPHVDSVFTFQESVGADPTYRAAAMKRLRELRADTCFHTVFSRSPLGDHMALNSGCITRIAHVGDNNNLTAQERAVNDPHYTRLIESPGEWSPELRRHRDFLAGLGIQSGALVPKVWTDEDDAGFASETLQHPSIAGRKVIALFAAAISQLRMYPYLGTALKEICREQDLAIVALGSSDHFQSNQMQLDAAEAPHLNLCGKTAPRQAVEVMRACVLGVGSDTGVAHMACAVGTPNIVVMGGGHFGRFFPYSPLTTIACLPLDCDGCRWTCRYTRPYCMWDIHPAVVEIAIRATLGQRSTRPRVFAENQTLWPAAKDRPRAAWPQHMLAADSVELYSIGATQQQSPNARGSQDTRGP